MADRHTHGLPRWLAPDLPPEIQPTPWGKKSISLLGLTEFRASKFAEEGIYTFSDLEAYLERGGKLTDISHIGPSWAKKIRDIYDQYLSERIPEEYRT